ncbi:hypothetical protein Pden_1730 [Paracoccus denitrificans PD1222]|uniref:Uncharacterized protein n=1 Tax=Paracoccus denitrificans (strain Pd 1222) TaxID=318586 RepID=A1B2T3_PARDP|nr:hypothetical protein Pden_1730 [Paracoccus denitrificans PD1222]
MSRAAPSPFRRPLPSSGRRVVRRGSAIAATLAVLALGAGYAVLRLLPMEYDDLSGADPRVWVLLPAALRGFELPGHCAPPRYSRHFLECGGACGHQVSIRFGSRTVTEDRAAELAARAGAATGATEALAARVAPLAPDCPGWRLDLSFDTRASQGGAAP